MLRACVRACVAAYMFEMNAHIMCSLFGMENRQRFRSESMFLASSEICLSNMSYQKMRATHSRIECIRYIFNISWLFGLLCIERFESIVEAIDVRCIYFVWIDEDFYDWPFAIDTCALTDASVLLGLVEFSSAQLGSIRSGLVRQHGNYIYAF